MRYIIAFLLTVALLCFSIVTGRAEQPTELPSGTYYLSLTSEGSKEGLKELSGTAHYQNHEQKPNEGF